MTHDKIQEGDLAEIIGQKHFHHIVTIKPGEEIQSHKGIIQMDDLIGKTWGSVVKSHNGNTFYVLQPALTDLVKNIPRNTQILYPKDIGFVLLSLAIGPGKRVIEAGTGSGALTTAFAYSVGNEGRVFSYEMRPEMQKIAIENLRRVELDSRVDFKIRNITDGFDEKDADALFLDVPNSYDYLPQVRAALKPGGFFGSILPTMNQVTKLLDALKSDLFAFTEVCEILIRYYRPDAEKFRPVDRMVAHTGFLIFARPLVKNRNASSEETIMAADFFDNQDLN
ncbi:MAG: tRNA (adenine-N1)-methyltransferase [Flexilinea sp.]